MKQEKPSLPVTDLIKELQQKELITPGITLYPSTVYRILQKEGVGRKAAGKIDRRRFEAEYPNDIWQSDVLHGPMVEVDGKMRKSYLIAFIDDHPRLLPQAGFYLNERLISWLDAFRKALLTRGVPRRLYVDNSSAFRTKHLERICASLGIALIHTPPYTPQGRGKIERFFRSVRDRFLSLCPADLTLDDLNRMFAEWVTVKYHNRVHSSTGETPLQRFGRHIELTRTPPPPDLEVKNIIITSEIKAVNDRFNYAVVLGAIALVTGEIGAGKSTALRWIVAQLHPSRYRPIWITASSGSILEVYRHILAEFETNTATASRATLTRMIRKQILELARNRKIQPVLILDEASLLRLEVFAELHTITQFEGDSKTWLPIILIGQNNLADNLLHRFATPLAPRIVARSHLGSVNREKMEAYISHHLAITGLKKQPV